MFKLFLLAAVSAVVLGGCMAETAQFRAQPGQEAIVRDGVPAITSRKPYSIAMLRPAKRQFQAGTRPTYVLAIFSPTNRALNFSVSNVHVVQTKNGEALRDLHLYTYEELVREEQTRQFVGALLVGAAAAANSYSASRQGYYSGTANVYGPHGVSTVYVSGYSPVANAIAQGNAAAQNEAMIASAIEQGQANLANLERSVIKDNTVMPGEWYGGALVFDAPQSEDGKDFQISVQIGLDRHEFNISHVAVRT